MPFDPWITRGEDLDYLFNLRLSGFEMWFDNKWYVRHLPPATPDEPNRFLQDIYRWLYERAKLAFCSQRQELHQVTPASLMPYPGRWISPEVEERISKTILARIVAGPGRRQSFAIWCRGIDEARSYAGANAQNYARLLSFWPTAIDGLWNDEELAAKIAEIQTKRPEPAPRRGGTKSKGRGQRQGESRPQGQDKAQTQGENRNDTTTSREEEA